MKMDWSVIAASGLAVCLAIAALFGSKYFKGVQAMIFYAVLGLITIAVAGVILYIKNRQKQSEAGAAGGRVGAAPAGGETEIDILVREADHRLAAANSCATI